MEQESIKYVWILITIISSLISGILGVVISIVYHQKAENRQLKFNTLKDFVGYRYDVKCESFTKALNEIFLVFQDSKKVIEKLNELHEIVVSRQTALIDDKLIALFKEMCKNLNIDPNKYSEFSFLKAFNVKA